MDNLSMGILNRYSNFKPQFKLVSRTVSSLDTIVSDYESPSPMKDHKYHLQVEESALRKTSRYSFI